MASNDQLQITVGNRKEDENQGQETELRQLVVVQQDGTINLPVADNIFIEGLTEKEASSKLMELFDASGSTRKSFEVSIEKFRSSSVLVEGSLAHPGKVYLSRDVLTLGEAIANAGGLIDEADLEHGILIRGDERYLINYKDIEQATSLDSILLEANDKVYFPSLFPSHNEEVFYIFGEVTRQGAYSIPPSGVTLLGALGQAHGTRMLTSNMNKIFFIRINDTQPIIYRLDMSDIIANPDVILVAGDRIFIPATGLATWDRTWRQLIPMFTTSVQGATVYSITTN
jgi:protein involved in polysaccharide export with SLBB domain